jgi:hypothetical protein
MGTHWLIFFVDSYCGNYTTANGRVDELLALADEKDAALWRAWGLLGRGWLLDLSGRAGDAVQMIPSGIAAWRSTGATMYLPSWLADLAAVYAELGQLNEAWRCIGEAMSIVETAKERWLRHNRSRAPLVTVRGAWGPTTRKHTTASRSPTMGKDSKLTPRSRSVTPRDEARPGGQIFARGLPGAETAGKGPRLLFATGARNQSRLRPRLRAKDRPRSKKAYRTSATIDAPTA